MNHLCPNLLGALVLLAGTFAPGAPTNELPHITSWVGNTWGAAGARYAALTNNMQMFVGAMGVAGDGTVFTSSAWDEAHKEMGRYRWAGRQP